MSTVGPDVNRFRGRRTNCSVQGSAVRLVCLNRQQQFDAQGDSALRHNFGVTPRVLVLDRPHISRPQSRHAHRWTGGSMRRHDGPMKSSDRLGRRLPMGLVMDAVRRDGVSVATWALKSLCPDTALVLNCHHLITLACRIVPLDPARDSRGPAGKRFVWLDDLSER